MSNTESVDRILSEYDRDAELYARFCEKVEDLLTELLKTSNIRISAVTSRLKKRSSFERKVRSAPESKYGSARSVTDIAGARVVVYFEDDVDRVDSIIRDNFEIDVFNSINKRRTLRSDQFGYQSLHLVASLNEQRLSQTELRQY